jgi:WD40 repeat protein
VVATAISPDGQRVALAYQVQAATTSGSGAMIYDVTTGQSHPLVLRDPPIFFRRFEPTALAFSPDGRLLASGEQWPDPVVRVWDAQARNPLRTYLGHRGRVTCLAFSPDGKRLASGSVDTTTLVWDTNRIGAE